MIETLEENMTKKKPVKKKASLASRYTEGVFVGLGIGLGLVLMQVLLASATVGIQLLLNYAGF